MEKLMNRIILSVLLLLSLVDGAAADVVLDGSYGYGVSCCYTPWINPSSELAQTFTIQNTGLLIGVDFVANPFAPVSEPLNVGIYRGLPYIASGVIIDSPVAALTISPFTFDTGTLDLSPFTVDVTAGDVMSIVFSSDETSTNVRITAVHGGPGGLYSRNPLHPSEPYNNWNASSDTALLKTYVRTVPEPASLFLVGTGLTAFAMRGRIRGRLGGKTL
jgi:hypothetical protein